MSESRKRSRKSKLEIRNDDCGYEISRSETTEPPQKPYEPKIVPLYNDHDYCKPGSQRYARPTMATPIYSSSSGNVSSLAMLSTSTSMELSVNVKVEEFSAKNVNKDRQMFPNKKGRPSEKDTWQLPVIIPYGENKANKKLEKSLKAIKMFKYNPENLFSVSKHIASTSQNPADRILDITMRNLWGNTLCTRNEPRPHEAKIQTALETWQSWTCFSKHLRESPIFYQCHICDMAWWRLQPFREHIKTHNIDKFKVIMKENIHESMIIACEKDVIKFKFIDIDGGCWRCGNNVEHHSKNYTCSRCNKTFYTCSVLREHESACVFLDLPSNKAKERQCGVCHQVQNSIEDVEKHIIEAHCVRSDLPTVVTSKFCNTCRSKYHYYNSHNCSSSAKNLACQNCCRKFATKQLAFEHMDSEFNKEVNCQVCSKIIPSKCLEMEHMSLVHSNNYTFAYKCTLCTNQFLLFLDERSIHLHRELWHQKKYDRRRAYYEKMLVPKPCIQENVEDIIQNDHDYGIVDYHTDSDEFDELVNEVVRAHSTLKNNDDEKDFCVENYTEPPKLRMLSTDVDITVDEIDIKQESEYSENGEVDYEQMLQKMFAVKEDAKDKESTEKIEVCGIRIKEEPDDIEIIENPVDRINLVDDEMNPVESLQIVQVKTEPIDEDEIETLTIKVEPDIDIEDIENENIVIKNELDLSYGLDEAESMAFDVLVSDLENIKNKRKDEEMTIDVKNKAGKVKKKKVYACKKCGYTSVLNQYRIHVQSSCTLCPGTTNGSHPCTKCGLTFAMFRNYVLHFDSHGFGHMACPVCKETFETLVKLLPHVQRHIKNTFVGFRVLNKSMREESSKSKKHFKCQQCRSLVAQDGMFAHWEQHFSLEVGSEEGAGGTVIKEEPPELTVDCERVTMNNKTLEPQTLKTTLDHLQLINSNIKECVVCYRAFTRRSDVKRHLVEHLLMDAHMYKMKYKCFRCQLCSAGFPHPEKYKFHMREHGGMPIYKCELCNKTFSDSSNFAKHKKTHNVRVLICDLCNKKFHSRPALEKHINDHETRPKIKCKMCPAEFMTSATYKRHRYAAHEKPKFKCILCDLTFQSSQQKWNHNWEVHKERKEKADCPICRKSFRKFHDVRIHVKQVHNSALGVVRKDNMQFFSVRDLKAKKKKETLIVCDI